MEGLNKLPPHSKCNSSFNLTSPRNPSVRHRPAQTSSEPESAAFYVSRFINCHFKWLSAPSYGNGTWSEVAQSHLSKTLRVHYKPSLKPKHSVTALQCHKNIRLKICIHSTQGHTIVINTVQTPNMQSLKKTQQPPQIQNPQKDTAATCCVAEMAFPHPVFQKPGKISSPSHLSKAPGGKLSFYSSSAFPKTL